MVHGSWVHGFMVMGRRRPRSARALRPTSGRCGGLRDTRRFARPRHRPAGRARSRRPHSARGRRTATRAPGRARPTRPSRACGASSVAPPASSPGRTRAGSGAAAGPSRGTPRDVVSAATSSTAEVCPASPSDSSPEGRVPAFDHAFPKSVAMCSSIIAARPPAALAVPLDLTSEANRDVRFTLTFDSRLRCGVTV